MLFKQENIFNIFFHSMCQMFPSWRWMTENSFKLHHTTMSRVRLHENDSSRYDSRFTLVVWKTNCINQMNKLQLKQNWKKELKCDVPRDLDPLRMLAIHAIRYSSACLNLSAWRSCKESVGGLVHVSQYFSCPYATLRRRSAVMVSVLASGFSGPGSSPGRGHRVVLLGRTQLLQYLSPLRCINKYLDRLASHPGGEEILLAPVVQRLDNAIHRRDKSLSSG